MSKINKTPIETRLAIERRSAAMLPDRPTQAGLKPWDIRNALFSAIIADKGACLMGEIDRIVDEANAAIDAMRIKSGTLTVPMSRWKGEETPRAECAMGSFYTAGCAVFFTPEDDETKEQARLARLSMAINETMDGEWSDVVVFVGEGGEIPSVDLHFRYVVIPTESEADAIVALVGVDAYGEGGGGTGSGVDEEAVKTLISKEVPEWARAKQKPEYTAEEVKARPATWTPTAEEIGARPSTWMPTAREVGADPVGTASTHNVDAESHQDLRVELQRLADRLNAALNSDDTSLDDLKEIVAYIKSNKTLIDGITSSKVSVTDIVDNLITNVSNRPLSAAQGVALKLLIDSLEEIVEGKVTAEQVAAKIKAALTEYITKEEADKTYAKPSDVVQATYTALQTAKESGEFDGKTPVNGVDFNTPKEKAEWETFIITEIAKRGQIKFEFVKSIEACTDPLKIYVLPDHYVYAAIPVERPVYTNLLDKAVGTDEKPYKGDEIRDENNNLIGHKPYKTGLKINSKGEESSVTGMCSTGFIPVTVDETTGDKIIQIKNTTKASGAGVSGADFHLFYKADFTIAASGYYGYYEGGSYNTKPDENGVIEFKLPASAVYYRYTTGVINDDSIFTINDPITDETKIVYEWRNVGISFAPADYEGRVVDLETASKDHETRLSEIEEKLENGDFDGEKNFAERVADFKNWDRSIFDRIPAYTIGDESKPALTTEMRTSTALYQAYDKLMALVNTDSWTYITKTPLGQDSAGYDVYRYDFKMPDQPRTAVTALSKAIPKVILVSGVHPEWAGVYALYNTMFEIATNPDLADLKHNTHFIVVPMVNAYSCNTSNRKNINGVDIARNFEVDWVETTDTSASTYGGTEPLSELEAQYVDAVMSENPDALYFISCHNYFGGDDYLNLWACAGTKYTHNLGQKLVDKLTRVWCNKYDFVPDNTYLGAADIAAPNGSEGKQAIKYGIQGLTLECRNGFGYRSTDTYTAFSQSRATEVYVNFLLTALGNHEATDKRAL